MLPMMLMLFAAPRPEGLDPELAPPVHVMVDGKPLDVEREGHAAPFVGDYFGDGKLTLLVGQHSGGKLRIYKNTGQPGAPKFESFEWFQASESLGKIEAG